MLCIQIEGTTEKELGQATIFYLQKGKKYLFLGQSKLTIEQTKYGFFVFSGNRN